MKAKVARIAIPVIMALFLILVMASPAFAADISGSITYPPSGSVVGTYVGASAPVCTLDPITPITAGSLITLTFPAGTALANIVASDFTISQVGGGTAAPSAIAFDSGARTITFTVAAGSLSGTGLGVVTIATSATAGGDEIRHPTTTTTSGTFSVATSVGDSGSISTVVFFPAPAASFNVVTSGGGTETAGAAFSVTLTALDTYGNTCDSGPNAYTGAHTINFASAATASPNGTPPTIPASESINFTAGVGTSLTSFILTNAEEIVAPTIGATDGIVTGFSAPITVNPAPYVSFTVVTSGGGTETAGTAFSVTLTARDTYGNTCDTGPNIYNGAAVSIDFTSTATASPNGTTPTIPTPQVLDFSVTPGIATTATNFILVNPGETPTITATDALAGISGTSGAITVNPGAAASFNVVAPGAVTAGAAFNVTLTAFDAFGNTATGYAGVISINFTSTATASPNGTPPTIPSPQNITFTAGVGTGTGFILVNPGETPTITATDPAIPITGTSGAITVNPAAINYYTVTSTSYTPTVGRLFTVTVTAYDQYGNVVTTDSTTSVTMTSNSATMLFDSNGNGIFGQRGDNIKTLSAGTFNISARDTIGRSGVTITATDPNGNTGTSSPYTISGWTGQAGPGAAPPAAPPPAAAAPPSGGMPVGALAGLWAGVAVICGLIIWLGIFRR